MSSSIWIFELNFSKLYTFPVFEYTIDKKHNKYETEMINISWYNQNFMNCRKILSKLDSP